MSQYVDILSVCVCGVKMIRHLRDEVHQLQLVLSHKDAELWEKDARIVELENQLRSLLANGT